MDTPGIHLAKKIDKMGMRCSDTAVVFFDDVRVPAKNIIGDEGDLSELLSFGISSLGLVSPTR